MAAAPGAGSELLSAPVQRGRRPAARHAQGEGGHLTVRSSQLDSWVCGMVAIPAPANSTRTDALGRAYLG